MATSASYQKRYSCIDSLQLNCHIDSFVLCHIAPFDVITLIVCSVALFKLLFNNMGLQWLFSLHFRLPFNSVKKVSDKPLLKVS